MYMYIIYAYIYIYFLCVCVCVSVLAQSCLTLCNPMDCSPPGFSVHGILPTRTLEWVAISSSRGSFPPRDQTVSPTSPAMASRFFTTEPPRKPTCGYTNMYTSVCIFVCQLKKYAQPKSCELNSIQGSY